MLRGPPPPPPPRADASMGMPKPVPRPPPQPHPPATASATASVAPPSTTPTNRQTPQTQNADNATRTTPTSTHAGHFTFKGAPPPARSPPPAAPSRVIGSLKSVTSSGNWAPVTPAASGATTTNSDSSSPSSSSSSSGVSHRPHDSLRVCSYENCFAPSEIGGCCIKHYYSSNTANVSPSPSNRPTAVEAAKKSTDERHKLCDELVQTEKSYGSALKRVVRGMILRLNKLEESGLTRLMDKEEMTQVFMNISEIFDLQQRLYRELKELRFNRELYGPLLGQCLTKFAPFFRLYVNFVNNFDDSQRRVTQLRDERPALDTFFRHCEAVEGMRLADCMISPVQRVPRYALLLRAIIKCTAPSDGSYAGIHTALVAIESVANDINESFRKNESRAKVFEIAARIEGLTNQLVTPHRVYIRDGPLEKRYNNTSFKLNDWKQYHWFLFNDLLLYCTIPNARGACKLKFTLPVHDMSLVDLPNSDKSMNAFEIKSSVKSFVVMARTEQEKAEWMEAIRHTKEELNKNKSTLKLATSQAPHPPNPSSSSSSGMSASHSQTLRPPPPRPSPRDATNGTTTLPAGFKVPAAYEGIR